MKTRGLVHKCLCVVLSACTAFGTVPVRALAETVDELESAVVDQGLARDGDEAVPAGEGAEFSGTTPDDLDVPLADGDGEGGGGHATESALPDEPDDVDEVTESVDDMQDWGPDVTDVTSDGSVSQPEAVHDLAIGEDTREDGSDDVSLDAQGSVATRGTEDDEPSIEELLSLRQVVDEDSIAEARNAADSKTDPCYSDLGSSGGGHSAGLGTHDNLVEPLLARARFFHDSGYMSDIFSGSNELEYQSYRTAVEGIPAWKAGYEYWEAYKSVNPGTMFENFTRYGNPVGTVGFYETALMDMLIEVEDFDSMWREVQPAEAAHSADGTSTTDVLIQFTKSLGKPEEDLSNVSITDFSDGEQAELIAIIANQSRYQSMKSYELGENLLDVSDTLGDLAKNVKKLEAVADYSESMREVLNIVAESSGSSEELRLACHVLRDKMSDEFDLNKAIAFDLANIGVKELCGSLLGDTWDSVVDDLGGDWKDLVGVKGLAAAGRFVSLDSQYEAYRRMVVMDEIQPALKSARDVVWQRYESNPSCENARVLGSMCDLLVGETLVSYDYAKQYLDAIDEAYLSVVLDNVYGDLGPDWAIEHVETEKARTKREYRWINMLVDDIANQDEPGHSEDINNVSVGIESQEDFSHWASMAVDATEVLGKQTMLHTVVLEVPNTVIGSKVLLGPVSVYGDLSFLEGGSLSVRGDLLVRAADHSDGEGGTTWFGGVVHLGYGNSVMVSGDMDIYGLEMSDPEDAVRVEGDLNVSGTDREVSMIAGRVEVGDWLYLGAGTGAEYGFLPEQDCALSFFGDGESGYHYATGHPGDHINLGRVDLNNTLFISDVGPLHIELVSDTELLGGGFVVETLDLCGHSLTAPEASLTIDNLEGITGPIALDVQSMMVTNGLRIPNDSSLDITLSEEGNGLWVSDVNLGENATMHVSGDRLVQYDREGASSSMNLGAGASVSVDSEAKVLRPTFAEATTLSVGGNLEICGPIDMLRADSAIVSEGALRLDAANQVDGLNGRVEAYDNVTISTDQEGTGPNCLFEGTGVLALKGPGHQSVGLSSGLASRIGNVGVWNSDVDLSELECTIIEGDLSLATIEEIPAQSYEGSEVRPTPTVTLLGQRLNEDQAYSVSYEDNARVGTATITVTGKNGFTGSKSATFSITGDAKTDISVAETAVSAQTYTGKALMPKVTVTLGGAELKEGVDYTVAYKNNVNAGTATVTVTGAGNYEGTKSATFKINPKAISKATVAAIPNKAYTGSAIKPALTVKDGTKTLKSGTDYTVAYKNNVSKGTATVTIKGKGNYSGTKSATFKIVAASVAKATVSKIANQRYDGTAKKPSPTVKVGTRTLKLNTDYTLTYKNNVKAGTATVTIKGKGNYTGSKSVTFKVVAQKGTWTKVSGKWRYVWSDKKYPKSVFLDIDGKTYYFNASGYMLTGWQVIGGKDYYFDSSGAMAKSKWVGNYWLKADGTMARNEWVDGGRYHVDKNGKYDKKR